MNAFLLFFVLGAVLTAIVVLVLVSTTASAAGYEGEPVRVKSHDR